MAYMQTHTIADTDRRLVIKRVNSGNTETAGLVVNAASLAYALSTITTVASANTYKVGELVTSSNASPGWATVQDVSNATSISVTVANGVFAATDVITGNTTGRTRVQSGAIVPATYDLQVSRIVYNIFGNAAAAKVELMWEGTGAGANNRTIAILSGSGVWELDTHGMRVNDTANTATGNITLNCLNWGADSHYTLLLDVSKVGGYKAPYTDRNALGAY